MKVSHEFDEVIELVKCIQCGKDPYAEHRLNKAGIMETRIVCKCGNATRWSVFDFAVAGEWQEQNSEVLNEVLSGS